MLSSRFILPLSLIAAVAVALPAAAAASAYDDDDDIYYNPSKEPTKPKKEKQNNNIGRVVPIEEYWRTHTPTADYPAADTYQVPAGAGLDVDVDAYNRRTSDVPDSITLQQFEEMSEKGVSADTYTYTRRLEKYHNGDIVNGSGDQALIDSYYSTSSPEVNIYVSNPYCTYWGYPYYRNYWGPSWSISWGFDPWFDFSWGPGYWGPAYWGPGYWGPGYWGPGYWGPGYWGPGWHPGPAPGPGRPAYSWNNPGSSRPHGPATARPGSSTATRRPGAFSAGASNASRPGTINRPAGSSSSSSRRPGAINSPSYNGNSGQNSGYNSQSRGGINQSQRSNSNRSATPSYNSSQSRGGSSSWGGSRGGGSRGGGGTHGGAGRGGRR